MYEIQAFKVALSALGLVAAVSAAMAQTPPSSGPPPTGMLHYESKLGAFKFFNGDGSVTFKFKGTVLIRNFQGTPIVTGAVKKEYPLAGQDGHGRIAYFGDGTFTFKGHFDSLQWFGQDVSGTWDGRGGYRVYGDYDKNLETGWMWEGNDQSKRHAWPTQSPTYVLPAYKMQQQFAPVLKKKGS